MTGSFERFIQLPSVGNSGQEDGPVEYCSQMNDEGQ